MVIQYAFLFSLPLTLAAVDQEVFGGNLTMIMRCHLSEPYLIIWPETFRNVLLCCWCFPSH